MTSADSPRASDAPLASGSPTALPAAPSARAIDAPIRSVVVLEDRSHATRRGRIELSPGTSRLTIPDVSPIIVDKTLRATLQPAEAGSDAAPCVVDVRCRRLQRTLRSESPEAIAAIESELLKVQQRLASLENERSRIDARIEHLVAAHRLYCAETAGDVAWNRPPSDDALAEAQRIREAERAARRRLVDLGFEVELAREEETRLVARLNSLHNPSVEWAAEIELDVEVAASGAFVLEIDYVTPNACWRPSHTARLDAHGRLAFSAAATVWQYTGEAWAGVELFCSTDRPSLGVEPPALSTDRLKVRKKPTAVEIEARDQTIQTAGLGSDDSMEAEHADFGRSPRAERSGSDERVPGVDDNGEPQHLKCTAAATVPSDGRPHRLPLFDFETEAHSETFVAAELEAAAILKTTQTNRAPRPLLAGPVDLIRDGGLIGRTSIRFIAPKEIFALGWGPDPDVRVRRDEDKLTPEPKLLSLTSWLVTTHHVRVRLSNVGPHAQTLTIRERVPISEIEKVQIVFDSQRTTGKLKPDADGFVTWTVALAPFGRALVELWYDVKKSKDVVGAT